MGQLKQKLKDIIFAHPKKLSIFSLILLIALTSGLTQYQSKNDVRIWFSPDDPKLESLNFLEKTFGNDETLVIAVELTQDGQNLFNEKHIKIIQDITKRAWKIPQVIRVESLTNYNHIYADKDDIMVEPLVPESFDNNILLKQKEIAIADPAIKDYLIDEDAKLALIFAHLIPSNVQNLNYRQIVLGARQMLSEYENQGLSFHVTGKAGLNYAFEEVSMGDVKTILPLLLLLIIGYLYYVFRSFKAMVLPLVIVVATVTSSLGLGFWIGIKFSAILAILPIILVAIGIADSVHIMVNFFQFYAQAPDSSLASRLKSIEQTLDKNLLPTFLTSFSTSVGLFSLMTTKLVPISHLGLLAGIGCLLAWVFTIFLLIPVLTFTKFSVPPIFKEKQNSASSKMANSTIAFVDKFRYPIVLVSFSLMAGSIYIARDIQTNADPDSYFSNDASISKSNAVVKKYIGGSAGPDLILHAGGVDKAKSPEFLKKVETFNEWLRSLAPVNNTVSILDVIKKMNQVIHQDNPDYYKIPDQQNEIAQYLFLYTLSLPPGMDINNRISLDYSSTRISLLWTVYDTTTWAIYRDKIISKANQLGLNLTIAGKANLFQNMIDYVVDTFIRSIFMAMSFVALMLMFVFRSVKVGLISLIPNLMPLSFGAATMAIFGMDLNLGTSLVASVCLGIAVDDTIHFLSNYFKYQDEGYTGQENMSRIFRYTASALIITTFILSSAFGLYVFGDFLPNVNFGILCSVTLMSALIIDLVFLPAFLLVIDKKNHKKEQVIFDKDVTQNS